MNRMRTTMDRPSGAVLATIHHIPNIPTRQASREISPSLLVEAVAKHRGGVGLITNCAGTPVCKAVDFQESEGAATLVAPGVEKARLRPLYGWRGQWFVSVEG